MIFLLSFNISTTMLATSSGTINHVGIPREWGVPMPGPFHRRPTAGVPSHFISANDQLYSARKTENIGLALKIEQASITAMPTIAERLKELESVDDAGLMMGYRFLVTPRRKRSGAKVMCKKAVKKNTRPLARHKSSSPNVSSKRASL